SAIVSPPIAPAYSGYAPAAFFPDVRHNPGGCLDNYSNFVLKATIQQIYKYLLHMFPLFHVDALDLENIVPDLLGQPVNNQRKKKR
ncbi:MAG: hypothetical protein ABRQ24_05125, partial [Syntrophomonadaceae bacterium]